MTIKCNMSYAIKSMFVRDNIKITRAASKNIFSYLSFKTNVNHEIFKYIDAIIKEKEKLLSIHNIFSSFYVNSKQENNFNTKSLTKQNDPYRTKKINSYRAFDSQNECQQFFLVLEKLDQVTCYENAIQFTVFLKETMPKKSEHEFLSFISSIDSVIQPITNIINEIIENLETKVILHAESHVKKQLNSLFTQEAYKTMLEDAQPFLKLKRRLDYNIKKFEEVHHGSSCSFYGSNDHQSLVEIIINEPITEGYHGGNPGPQSYLNKKIPYISQGDNLVAEECNARERFAEKYKIDSACLEALTEISPEEFKFELLKLGFSEAFKNLVAEGEEISSRYLTEQLNELSPGDTNLYFSFS